MVDEEYADRTWNMLGSQIKTWGAAVIFGVTMITQLLSIFGIAPAVNLMMWEYLVGYGGMVVSLAAMLVWAWGIHLGWASCRTAYETPDDLDSDEVTECTAWNSYVGYMDANMKLLMAEDTALAIVIGTYMEDWLLAQWWAMPEEERYAMWEEKHDDMDDKMYKLFAKAH